MKEKTKDRLKSWCMTLGFACAIGLCAFATSCDKVIVKTNAIEYVDNQYTIEFSANELNDYTFENLIEYLDGGSISLTNTFFDFFIDDEEITVVFSEFDGESYIFSYDYNDTDSYTVNLDTISKKWHLYKYTEEPLFDDEIDFVDTDFVLNSTVYSGIKDAIELDIDANSPSDIGMVGVLQQFIQIITSGLVTFAGGVANGIIAMASGLFLTGGSLSIFGGIVAIFAGLALAVGITTRVYTWVTSLGN